MTFRALENLFAMQLDAAGLGGYVREVQAIPGRKFRFDFCTNQVKSGEALEVTEQILTNQSKTGAKLTCFTE